MVVNCARVFGDKPLSAVLQPIKPLSHGRGKKALGGNGGSLPPGASS